MQDSISIIDCHEKQHIIKINNIKNFSTYQGFKNPPITTIYLKELENNFLDIKTYESEESVRKRFSKLYDELHKND